MRASHAGFTLMELLAVIFPMSLIAVAAVGFFTSHNRTYLQQDLAVATEENLRAAMGMVTDTLRTAGCAVPPSNLDEWISWVPGFTEHPVVVTDGGADPDTVSVAACAPKPIGRLSANAAAGGTTLMLASDYAGLSVTDLLNTSDKSLIAIGDRTYARVKAVSGTSIQIDTDPTNSGAQGLARELPAGMPVTRIDVVTFEVQIDSGTGRPWLRFNKHRGSEDPAAEGVSDLQVTTVVPGSQYRVALTARSEAADPISGQLVMRTLTADVQLRN